jgi:hypothetical protein
MISSLILWELVTMLLPFSPQAHSVPLSSPADSRRADRCCVTLRHPFAGRLATLGVNGRSKQRAGSLCATNASFM